MTSSARVPNRLINEKSPYLLQHAYNPVDWYPWGEEAFEKARREDKPLFLSIGYSTCHWCHVMERESFEDDEAAAALNRDFICIKVDKEERPDIDAVYMSVCQALTGSGGWPLTIFMMPDQKPFFAGTYFPKYRRYGHPGLLEMLAAISKAWKSDRDSLLESTNRIIAANSGEIQTENIPIDKRCLETAARQLAHNFDTRYGGFGSPPKFPMPHNLLFLLRCHHLGIGESPLKLVEQTLTAMYKGGIFDHIGGGFSRYSTDAQWLAPHFEKMLYDNALLIMAYLECYMITKNPLYKGVAEKTLAYIRLEMTSPDGAFYSAQDADIGGEEGKFYTFTSEEIISVLGEADGYIFCQHYDITTKGNFEGKNILNRIRNRETSLPDDKMKMMLEKMYQYRTNRYKLHKDDKVLTSWNALMIAAHAKAYRTLGEISYLHSAEKAYSFLRKHLLAEDGGLLISYRDGKAKGIGLLDDYAFLSWACLEIYEATFQTSYLEHACKLMKSVIDQFGDVSGGFYLSSKEGEALIFRPKEQYDGAMPSGNSAAAWCLARLTALTGDSIWREALNRQLVFYSNIFHNQPTAVTFALLALMQTVCPTQELVCVTMEESEKTKLAWKLGAFFHPQTAILAKSPVDEEILSHIAAYTRDYPIPQNGKTQFYLCQNQKCFAPETNFDRILEKIM